MTDDLSARLASLQPPAMDLPSPAVLASAGRRRRRGRRALEGAGLALAVAGAAVVVPSLLPAGSDSVVAADDPARATLTLDGTQPLACQVAPLSALSEAPGAERADTPQAAALRELLRTGIAGMSFPPKDGWVVLASTPTRQTFGHRVGPVGVDQSVAVELRDGTWGFSNSGGCPPLRFGQREAARLDTYRQTGRDLLLPWMGGRCVGEDRQSQNDVRVLETDEVVQVLVVPGREAAAPNDGFCAGVGTSEQTTITLSRPLGDRRVEDAGTYPPRPLLSAQQERDRRLRETAKDARAGTLCTRAHRVLGAKTDIAYPLTAAVVRGALPDLPSRFADLPNASPVAQCYLRPPGGGVLSVVIADGIEPYVYDRTHSTSGLFERLGDQ